MLLPSSISRRHFLAAGLGVSAFALAPRLRAEAAAPASDWRVIRARPGSAKLRGADKPATAIWGYEGMVPGPVLRVKRGEELEVRLVNELPEPTTIHWHGVRLVNAMDGVPHMTQPPVAPGESFDYRFMVPDAGTFWYHPHLATSEVLDRGVSGVLIVEESEPVDVDRDIVLVLDDWRLAANGEIDTASFSSIHDAAHAGRIGEHFTVNGAPALDIPAKTNERLRLRLVNVANARIMLVRIGRHLVRVMAVDGQPAEPLAARDGRVLLGPGNRVDVFLEATLAPGEIAPIVIEDGNAEITLARLVYDKGEPARGSPRTELMPLPPNPLPERMDFRGALRIDVPLDGGAMAMMMGGMMGRATQGMPARPQPVEGFSAPPIWAMMGKASDGHRGPPLFSVKRGRTVMIALPNRTAFPHAMHLHGHHFRLLDNLDDGWKPFWLDTVLVPARETSRIAFVADNPGKWMLHCHMIEHQETGMAAWFEVT
jgi:FtsP/CotA-like multicopper oxidase with cupredoxin domain